ncbi:hypothetical protein F4604DRAFT_1812091 [Suillus subluteus]|nr:hypothetical protein F4604DRAFT_1812091 [Suillus subluteus]
MSIVLSLPVLSMTTPLCSGPSSPATSSPHLMSNILAGCFIFSPDSFQLVHTAASTKIHICDTPSDILGSTLLVQHEDPSTSTAKLAVYTASSHVIIAVRCNTSCRAAP